MKVFMSRESILSEISSAAAFIVSASAISVSTDSIFSHVDFILALRSSSEAVVTSLVDVGPVEAEDVGGNLVKGVEVRSSSGTSVTSVVPSTASMLDVGPVEAEDMVGSLTEGVKEVERVFAGVVSDDVCWFPEVKLTAVVSDVSVGHCSPASTLYGPGLKQ